MLKFSKKVEYGLIALQYMSKKRIGELTTARELSERHKISLVLMGKLLQRLAQKNFIVSIQGVKGGYFLAKPPEQITVQSVITAIEGKLHFADCLGPSGCQDKEREKKCEIKRSLKSIQSEVVKLLNNFTLKDFQVT